GGSDYQNEVHLRLQAGVSADHRRYINFAGYDGIDDWITGVNASNRWILYDANSNVHRFQFDTAASGGMTQISAAGAGAVILNKSNSGGENQAGSGGLELWDGGPYASQVLTFKVSSTTSYL